MKIIIRLLFHPLLNELNQLINRHLINSYPPESVPARTMVVFLIPLYIFSNITGRFLVTSLPDLVSTALVSLALGGIELFMRISLPKYVLLFYTYNNLSFYSLSLSLWKLLLKFIQLTLLFANMCVVCIFRALVIIIITLGVIILCIDCIPVRIRLVAKPIHHEV